MPIVPVKTDHSELSQVQLTPRWVLCLLGSIALDPCTESDNPTGAAMWIDRGQDGRRYMWRWHVRTGELIFVNPPFGDIPIWARKLATETKAAACRGFLLVPTGRSERMWFQAALRRAHFLWLPNVRVHYEKANRGKSSAPFPSCAFLFGSWAEHQLTPLVARGTLLPLSAIYAR